MRNKIDNRLAGEQFETEIAKKLHFQKTVNSGAYWGDGDLRPIMNHLPIMVEAKVKTGHPVVRADIRKDIEKLKRQSSKIGRDWLYIIKGEEELVICSLDLFAELTEKTFHVNDDG